MDEKNRRKTSGLLFVILIVVFNLGVIIGFYCADYNKLIYEEQGEKINDNSTLYMSDILYPGFYFDKENCIIWIDPTFVLVYDMEPDIKILKEQYKCDNIRIIQTIPPSIESD